jgi:hypothetical protein
MRKHLAMLILALAATAGAREAVGQSAPPPAAATRQTAYLEVFRQLLDMPGPTPFLRMSRSEAAAAVTIRPTDFYSEDKHPPDDAPLSNLLDYWERRAQIDVRGGRKPTEAVQARLLAACEEDPERFPLFLKLLPDAPQVAERVKKVFDTAQGDERFNADWHKGVREWLTYNSTYFLGDLLNLARKAGDKEGYVERAEAVRALAKVDWESAEPLLRSQAGGGQPRTNALALALLHRHAAESKDLGGEEHFRSLLKNIASDRNAPASARDTAIEELSQTEWPGRDDWYLSLFADPTLLKLTEGYQSFSPLSIVFDADPDKWIPVLTKLVESKDPAVRQNAAFRLVQFGTNNPRRDALLPVLRWLSDPDWLDMKGSQYAWFMQTMDELDIPESVPGLIWIVEHDESNRRWAGRTLAHYKDPRAVPALRKALADERDESSRQMLLQGLIACGGLPETEQLAALEAYASKSAAGQLQELDRYRSGDDEPLALPLVIGKYFVRQTDVPDSLVRAVLARAEALRKKNPALSDALYRVAEGWQAKSVDVDMLRRVGAGTADANTVWNALRRSEKLRENAPAELQLLAGAGGAPQGVAAVLLADEGLALTILSSRDEAAKLALLACARLGRMSLPIAQVGPLTRGKNPDLRVAAERYLISEDSPEARTLLLALHPGEAFVTGWRESNALYGADYSAMGRAEEKLRAEIFSKEDAPVEIIAMLTNHEQPSRVLRVYRDRVVYTSYEDASRYREAVVTPEQLSTFRQFLAANNLPDSGPLFMPCHHDCWVAQFLNVKREGGRRVFSHQGFDGWLDLLSAFDKLGVENAKLHYRLEEQIKGLEVLVADETLSVREVWQRGADLRVRVVREETEEEAERERREEAAAAEEDEGYAAASARRRRQAQEKARALVSWRVFDGNALGEVTATPEEFANSEEMLPELDDEKFPLNLNSRLARAKAGREYVLAGDFDVNGGLWKVRPGHAPTRLGGDGVYANPLVTPDGVWVVTARAKHDWARPNDVVRFDLRSGDEYRVHLPPAQEFDPLAYVAAHGKVLLRRESEASDGPAVAPGVPEFYLLDPATGQTQLVKGEFAPLMQEGRRALQPTGNAGEFWAAIPDAGKNETHVGRYDTKDFTLRTLFVVPHLTFDSFGMWVDEAGAKLYVVYEGQLLRLPLPAAR